MTTIDEARRGLRRPRRTWALDSAPADDAPTRLIAGSHHFISAAFAPFGTGDVRSDDLIDRLQPSVFCRSVTHATGHAGDVWLCHPFVVHTATWPHRGNDVRLMVQGTVVCEDGFAIDGSDPSPVARCIADHLHTGAEGRDGGP